MSVLGLDRFEAERLRADRVESGADRWDEVWDGVYVMSPLPNDEHQRLVARLTCILELVIGMVERGAVRPGVNISDRDEGWEHNYRCPDLAVFLQGGSATCRDTYWLGGPDFAIEIVSPDDRVREKLPFYAKVGVRELLVVDRDPWALELYRLDAGSLVSAGRSTARESTVLASGVVPLSFRLVEEKPRTWIDVRHVGGTWSWTV